MPGCIQHPIVPQNSRGGRGGVWEQLKVPVQEFWRLSNKHYLISINHSNIIIIAPSPHPLVMLMDIEWSLHNYMFHGECPAASYMVQLGPTAKKSSDQSSGSYPHAWDWWKIPQTLPKIEEASFSIPNKHCLVSANWTVRGRSIAQLLELHLFCIPPSVCLMAACKTTVNTTQCQKWTHT